MFRQGSAGPALLHLASAGWSPVGVFNWELYQLECPKWCPISRASPGTSGHSFLQPGPPGSTVTWHYLGGSRCPNLLKDWMQKSRQVISAAVCGQSNRLASPVSRGEEVTLSLWARPGIQCDYIWTKSNMCQCWSVLPTQRCLHCCDPLWSSAGVHGSSLVSVLS